MARVKTVQIEEELTSPTKQELASSIQQMFLEAGAGPRPADDARGLADVIHVSDQGSIAGDTKVRWEWRIRDGGAVPIRQLALSVSHMEKMSA